MANKVRSARGLQKSEKFPPEDQQLTRLITSWGAGDRAAENRIFDALYCSLRTQARICLRRESGAVSVGPTLLVNEAYLVLARCRSLSVNDRSHFIRIVARIMRNLLVDRARERKSLSNGGGLRKVDWEDATIPFEYDADRILAVAAVLDELALRSPDLARLVELRYFCGFTEEETARIMGVATRTIRRQWAVARIRLSESLHGLQ
jgi:RNA polymerase sigma factor (TIGR02999 family)